MSSSDEQPQHSDKAKPSGKKPMMSPVPGYNTSPVRPQNPEPYREPIMPSVPRPSRPELPVRHGDPTPTEEIDLEQVSREDQAKSALDRLRQKMAAVAEEYAQGKLNRAQFHAIYQRYQEQRDITERLLKRDPETGAWQSVVQPGHTSFLREHFQAKVESYTIYHTRTKHQIIRTGALQLPKDQVVTVLARLEAVMENQGNPGMAQRRLSDDRSVLFVPGQQSVSIVVFSLEPAQAQLERIEDMHQDFERANYQALAESRLDPREMVFPHRALFEQ